MSSKLQSFDEYPTSWAQTSVKISLEMSKPFIIFLVTGDSLVLVCYYFKNTKCVVFKPEKKKKTLLNANKQ